MKKLNKCDIYYLYLPDANNYGRIPFGPRLINCISGDQHVKNAQHFPSCSLVLLGARDIGLLNQTCCSRRTFTSTCRSSASFRSCTSSSVDSNCRTARSTGSRSSTARDQAGSQESQEKNSQSRTAQSCASRTRRSARSGCETRSTSGRTARAGRARSRCPACSASCNTRLFGEILDVVAWRSGCRNRFLLDEKEGLI